MVDMAVTGDKELRRAFRDLTGPEMKRAAVFGARKGANIMLPVARAMAPEDEGLLKKAIVARRGKGDRPGNHSMKVWLDPKLTDELHALSGKAAKTHTTRAGKKMKKGADYYYPAAQEFGWTTEDGTYHPGNPYLRPAFDFTKGVMGSVIQETIWRKMMEIWGRNATR